MNSESNKVAQTLRIAKSVVCIAIILCYIAGIVLMLTDNFGLGVSFWVISTLAGIGVLFLLRTQEKKRADLERELKEEADYQRAQAASDGRERP